MYRVSREERGSFNRIEKSNTQSLGSSYNYASHPLREFPSLSIPSVFEGSHSSRQKKGIASVQNRYLRTLNMLLKEEYGRGRRTVPSPNI